MMEIKISDLMDNIQDDTVQMKIQNTVSSDRIKEVTMKKLLHQNSSAQRRIKKLSKTSLIAAVLAATLAISALAAGLTYWVQKQAELRGILGIEGKDIPEYLEYNLKNDGEAVSGDSLNVTVLSTMRNRHYILISPVTAEQAETYEWYYKCEGMIGRSTASLVGDLEQAYDEITQSLMLYVGFYTEQMKLNETQQVTVTLRGSADIDNESEPYVGAEFKITPSITELATTSFTFDDGIVFVNPLTGETGTLFGAEINSIGMSWVFNYDNAEKHVTAYMGSYYRQDLSTDEWEQIMTEYTSWLNAFGDVIRDAVITLSDGSVRDELIAQTGVYLEDGVIKVDVLFNQMVELSSVESMTVNEKTYTPD